MAERVVAVIQARLGSARLPRKELAIVAGRKMLEYVVERTQAIPGIASIVLATTLSPVDNELEDFAREAGLRYVRGSEDDVLDRFLLAAHESNAETVVRITADCPLLDPQISGRVLAEYVARRPSVDYVSNVDPPTYPDGLDTEVVSVVALEAAAAETRRFSDLEHVTPYIRNHPERFPAANVRHHVDLSKERWTVDYKADLEFVQAVFEALGATAATAGMGEVLRLLDEHPEIRRINAGIPRNDGYERSLAAERPL